MPMLRGGAFSAGSASGITWIPVDLDGAEVGSWSDKSTAELPVPVCFLPDRGVGTGSCVKYDLPVG